MAAFAAVAGPVWPPADTFGLRYDRARQSWTGMPTSPKRRIPSLTAGSHT